MIVPVRCFSCGKVIGSSWISFRNKVDEEGKSVEDALNELNFTRYCCRGALMSHVELIDTVGSYE